MGDVTNFVALADPDLLAEVVGDNAEVVAVVIDVGGEIVAVAPADHDLLALVRCAPIHFHHQLVRLDQAGRLAQSLLTDLRLEEHEPTGRRVVACERRVRQRAVPRLGALPRQFERRGRVPVLGLQQ